jgi:hypothetical protein
MVFVLCLGALCFVVANYNGLKSIQLSAWAADVKETTAAQLQPLASHKSLAEKTGLGTDFDYRLARLPEAPQVKGKAQETAKELPEAHHVESQPPKQINKKGVFSESPLNPSSWGAKGDGSADNFTALKTMIAAIGSKPVTIMFHPGIYKIGSDLILPANISLVFMNGAMLKPGRVAGNGTLTYTPTASSTTIVNSRGTLVTLAAADVNLRAGMYVKAGSPLQTRKIREVGPDFTWLETWEAFSPGVSGSFSHSNITVDCTKPHGLTFGEYIYAGGQTLVNRNWDYPKNDKHFFTRGYPLAGLPAGTHWERGVQIVVQGSLEAGLYQICTGDGNLKFGKGTVQFVRPEWWGAKADGAADRQAALNSAAIDKALNSHYGDYRIPVQFSAGSYKVASEIWLDDSVHLTGVGSDGYLRGGTTIAAAKNTFHVIHDVPNRGYSDKRIENLTIIAGQKYPCNGLNVTHNTRDLWVYNCTFYGCGGYGIFTHNWGIGEIAHCKITGCVGGFYLNAFDMKVNNNEISTSWTSDLPNNPNSLALGHLLATTADRDKWSGWTKGWIWSNQLATHTGGGGTTPLTQKLTHAVWKGWTYRLIFHVTGGTRGTVTPWLGGVAGITVPFNGGYSDQIIRMTSTLDAPNIEFRPSDDFDGSIVCTSSGPKSNPAKDGIILKRTGDGIFLAASNSLVSGNIIYGDAYSASGIKVAGSSTNIITNNRVDSCYYNIYLANGGGQIDNNNIIGDAATPKTFANIYGGPSSKAIIENNHISNNNLNSKVWGIYFNSDSGNCVAHNNSFTKHNGGYFIYYNAIPTTGDYPFIADNYGIDLQCPWPILDISSSSPKVAIAKRWKTKCPTPRPIADFAQGCNGKEIIVVFGDANATVQFSGNTKLKGHGGVDWKPSAGDHLRAVKKGPYWYCECVQGGPDKQQ